MNPLPQVPKLLSLQDDHHHRPVLCSPSTLRCRSPVSQGAWHSGHCCLHWHSMHMHCTAWHSMHCCMHGHAYSPNCTSSSLTEPMRGEVRHTICSQPWPPPRGACARLAAPSDELHSSHSHKHHRHAKHQTAHRLFATVCMHLGTSSVRQD